MYYKAKLHFVDTLLLCIIWKMVCSVTQILKRLLVYSTLHLVILEFCLSYLFFFNSILYFISWNIWKIEWKFKIKWWKRIKRLLYSSLQSLKMKTMQLFITVEIRSYYCPFDYIFHNSKKGVKVKEALSLLKHIIISTSLFSCIISSLFWLWFFLR